MLDDLSWKFEKKSDGSIRKLRFYFGMYECVWLAVSPFGKERMYARDP